MNFVKITFLNKNKHDLSHIIDKLKPIKYTKEKAFWIICHYKLFKIIKNNNTTCVVINKKALQMQGFKFNYRYTYVNIPEIAKSMYWY